GHARDLELVARFERGGIGLAQEAERQHAGPHQPRVERGIVARGERRAHAERAERERRALRLAAAAAELAARRDERSAGRAGALREARSLALERVAAERGDVALFR